MPARAGPAELLADPLTVVFLVAGVNAINLSDGLDGLAGGTVAIGLSVIVLASISHGAAEVAVGWVATTALGAVLGFLLHNRHPARVFMGDSGSMLIGLVLSATAITVTTQFSSVDFAQTAEGARASLLAMLVPLAVPILILVVPLADLLMAVVRRTAAGRSPFAPGISTNPWPTSGST